MSVMDISKNYPVFLVIVIAFAGGSQVLQYNNSNISQGVTEDKFEAMQNIQTKMQEDLDELRQNTADHNAMYAHPGISAGVKGLTDWVARSDRHIEVLEEGHMTFDDFVP